MGLKERVKRIERGIMPTQKAAFWIVDDTYNAAKKDQKGKLRVEQKITAIIEGETQSTDGVCYQPGDVFYIISKVYANLLTGKTGPRKAPRMSNKEKSKENVKIVPAKKGASIEERIEALEKRKTELEKRLKEKGK